MGVTTDQPAVPFMPQAPKPGVPPSGIVSQPNIRGMANKAKGVVSERQRQFTAMMNDSSQQPQQPQQPQITPAQKYANAAASLAVNQDIVDRFVDWVLFG